MTPDINIAIMAWAVVAVAPMMTMIDAERELKFKLLAFFVLLMWPLIMPFAICYVAYRLAVRSTQQIRTDLRNRGLMKEFDAFLEEREAPKK